MTVRELIKSLTKLIEYDPPIADYGITIIADVKNRDFGTISRMYYSDVNPYFKATRADMNEEHPGEVYIKARY